MKKIIFCFAFVSMFLLNACKNHIETPSITQNLTLDDVVISFLNEESRKADIISLHDLGRVKKAVSKAVDCMFNTQEFSVLNATMLRSKSGDLRLSTLVELQDKKQKNLLIKLSIHENKVFIPYTFTRDLAELPPNDTPNDLCTYCEGKDCCYVEWNLNTNIISCKCEGGANSQCYLRQKKC